MKFSIMVGNQDSPLSKWSEKLVVFWDTLMLNQDTSYRIRGVWYLGGYGIPLTLDPTPYGHYPRVICLLGCPVGSWW